MKKFVKIQKKKYYNQTQFEYYIFQVLQMKNNNGTVVCKQSKLTCKLYKSSEVNIF